MKYSKVFLFFLVSIITAAACQSDSETNTGAKQSSFHVIKPAAIELTDGWVRPGSKDGNSVAYVNIFNGTKSIDTLLSIKTSVATKAEIHQSFEKNGLSGMRPSGHQAIIQNSTLMLEPGGLHIMLMQLNQELAEKDSVRLELNFSNAGTKKITVPVKFSN